MSESPYRKPGAPLYLRSSLLVIRYERERYVLFHPGSSSVTATDWLGAQAARLLLRGHADVEVARRVERRAAGAGERLRSLTRRLVSIGATSETSPRRTLRWRTRVIGALILGWLLSLLSVLLRIAPLWVPQLLYEALPETPFGKRTVAQSFVWMDENLRASGVADDAPQRRAEIARASAGVSTRLFFFLYLCALLPGERFTRFLPRVMGMRGFDELWRHVAQCGAVVAGIHTDLFFAVPIYLRTRGVPVACVSDVYGLGVALASERNIRTTFPPLFPDMIDSRALMSGKGLLTRLHAGEVVTVAFDAPPQREPLGEAMPTIPFLEHSVRRFDGPAWLAVRSGKPLVLFGTYRRKKQTVLELTVLQTDASRPVKEQIAALTEQLYTAGEVFIREHPESWMGWSYFHTFGAALSGNQGSQEW